MVGYGAQGLAILALYALFALWSCATWLTASAIRFENLPVVQAWKWVLASGSLIAGPLFAGLFLNVLLWLMPMQDWAVYLVALYGLPILFITAGLWRVNRAQAVLFLKNIARTENSSTHAIIGLTLFSIPIVLLLFQLLLLPLHGNDPLEYMQLGRAFHEHRYASIYPILTALPSSGFIAPWTHPPTYGLLISVAFALQGSSAVAGAAKLIGVWFAISTALLVGMLVYAAERRESWRMWATPFCVLTVPLYFELVQNGHIDALRLASFTLAIALASHFIAEGSRRSAILAGIGIGLAMLSHSIGVLAPAIAFPLILVCWQKTKAQLLSGLLLLFGTAFVMAGPHYIRNITIFGNAIQDSVPIWEIQSLRVTEFLRATRGLETVIDRVYIGIINVVLQPATLGYVVLIGLVMIPVLLWKKTRTQKASGLGIELFRNRGESVVIHLTVAVAGYASLIILSALAGSDLAVKNARYILTIVPIAVAVIMIGIGQLIDDDSFKKSAKHIWFRIVQVADSIRRFGPKRFHPVGREVPAPEPMLGFKQRMTRYTGLAVVIVAAFVVQSQIQGALRVFNGFVKVYYNSTALIHERMLESEHMKRNGSLLEDAIVDLDILEGLKKSDLVLTFRQASLGFYTTRNFRFHADHKLVDLFKIRSAEELHKALLAKNIHWIHTPNYSLPEINHSAFASLISDHKLVRPVVRSAGWALYAVQQSPEPVEVLPLAQAVPYAKNGALLYATTEEGSGMVDGRRAALKIDTSSGVAELRRERGLIKQLNRWDAIISRPATTRSSPVDSNTSDFYINGDPVKLNARLSGQGLAEVVVEYMSYLPVLPMGGVRGADLRSYKPDLVREVIWSGVLTSEPQTVSGWLTPVASLASPSEVLGLRRGARLLFRLRDGDVLRVHEWRAESVRFGRDSDRVNAIKTSVMDGWLFSSTSMHPRRGVRIRTPEAELSSQITWPFAPIGSQRLTTLPVTIALPPLYLQGPEWQQSQSRSALSRLEELQSTGSLRVVFNVALKGFGQVNPLLSIVCSVTRPEQDKELAQWTAGGISTLGEKTLTRLTTPLQLWGDKIEQVIWQETLPCVPRSVRLLIDNAPQRLVTIEERLINPERQRVGYIDVHRVEGILAGGDNKQNAVVIPLTIRPVIPEIPSKGTIGR